MAFLNDKNNLTPIICQSKQICQVVKSTMTAEIVALVDAAEASFWLSKLFSEIYSGKESQSVTLPLKLYIDSKQLHEALFSLHPVVDKKKKKEKLCYMGNTVINS